MQQRAAAAGYDSDFALWAESQATALREGRWTDLDIENLTEEIDDLTRRLRHKIVSHLIVLQCHLLKQRYQPERASKSWRNTIREQSRQIGRVLEEAPSLRRELPDFIARAYRDAREKASDETEIAIAAFPQTAAPDFERALNAALAGEDFSL